MVESRFLCQRENSLSLSQSVSHQGYKCRSRPEEDSTWKTVSKNVDASLIYSGTLDAIRTKGKIFRSKRVEKGVRVRVGQLGNIDSSSLVTKGVGY